MEPHNTPPMTLTDDYSHHRLTDHTQLREHYNKMIPTKGGPVPFWTYAERLYRKITMMRPGESFMVDHLVTEENRDVFIKLLCAFMASGIAQDFLFNKRYTMFRRVEHQLFHQLKEDKRIKTNTI